MFFGPVYRWKLVESVFTIEWFEIYQFIKCNLRCFIKHRDRLLKMA